MNNSEKNYREILEKSLNNINDEITLLETQNNKLLNIITNSSKRIERLRIEREQIQKELQSRVSSEKTKVDGITKEFIDNGIETLNKSQEKHSERLQELEKARGSVNSKIAKGIVDRRIRHERKKILKLRGAKNLISDIQKALIMPKYGVDKYRLGKFSKRQGNVNYYENKVAETEHKQSLLNPEESIVNKVQSVYYDIKGKYYAKRLDRANKKLEKLQQKGVQNRILGANVAAINKEDTDKLRQRINKQQKTPVMSQGPIPDITAETLAEEAVNKSNMTDAKTNTNRVALTYTKAA